MDEASTEYSAPATPAEPVIGIARVVPLAEMKTRYVFAVVRLYRGNRTQAATVLGVNRRTVIRMLEDARKLGLGEA
jgi:DNA-binding protein Fis